MSQEDSEMWRSHHNDIRLKRANNRKKGRDELLELTSIGYDVKPLNFGSQFRINNVIDIYPTNCRYHDLITKKRGSYQQGKLVEFVEKILTRK